MIVLDFPTVWARDANEYLAKAAEVHDLCRVKYFTLKCVLLRDLKRRLGEPFGCEIHGRLVYQVARKLRGLGNHFCVTGLFPERALF